MSIIGREGDVRHTEFIFSMEILNVSIFFPLLYGLLRDAVHKSGYKASKHMFQYHSVL